MKQELAEEGSRCSILTKQHRFNEHCCIRCCAPFTFLINPKRLCLDCQYNVCKTCCTYTKREHAWLCAACQKGSLGRRFGAPTNMKLSLGLSSEGAVLEILQRQSVSTGKLSQIQLGYNMIVAYMSCLLKGLYEAVLCPGLLGSPALGVELDPLPW
ncbi:hypothetical protein KUCAC02_031636, partial [Chaenocephalus aceratus]